MLLMVTLLLHLFFNRSQVQTNQNACIIQRIWIIVVTCSEDGWQGITGKAPTQEEFRSALTDHDLFMWVIVKAPVRGLLAHTAN